VVKKPPPEYTAVLFQTFPLTIFNQQDALALGTGVKQRLNGEDLLALQASIDQITGRLRKKMGSNLIGKVRSPHCCLPDFV
jgi:hypothetical protein